MARHDPDLTGDRWLTGLTPISLDGLTERAAMMSRFDTKYVLPGHALTTLVPALAERFDVLEITRQRVFGYETQYYDDAARRCFHEHHQGVRHSFKLRARRYADSGACFAEIKLKGKRGLTVKHRMPIAQMPAAALPDEAMTFARTAYADHYGKPFDYDLHPALTVHYRRTTLVSKDGTERMTLDMDLRFATGHTELQTAPGLIVVETKSAQMRGVADRLLTAAGQRAVPKCSKYCVGMAAMGEVTRFNRFLPALRALGLNTAAPEPRAPL